MNIIQAINEKEAKKKEFIDRMMKDVDEHMKQVCSMFIEPENRKIPDDFIDYDIRSFSPAHATAFSVSSFLTLMLKRNIMSTMTTGKSNFQIPLYQKYIANHLLHDAVYLTEFPAKFAPKVNDDIERIMSQYIYDTTYMKYLPILK